MDIKGLMRQAQEMQKKMQEAQEEASKALFEGSAGGSMVKVTVTGSKVAKKVEIDPTLISVDEKEILEDLIVAAHNNAKIKLKSKTAEEISKVTGGLGVSDFKWPT